VYALTGDGHAVCLLPRGAVSGAGRSDHARKATVFKVTRRRAHRVKSVTGTGRPSRPPAAGRGGASSPALFVGGLPPAVAPVSICVWPPAPPPSRRLQSLVPSAGVLSCSSYSVCLIHPRLGRGLGRRCRRGMSSPPIAYSQLSSSLMYIHAHGPEHGYSSGLASVCPSVCARPSAS